MEDLISVRHLVLGLMLLTVAVVWLAVEMVRMNRRLRQLEGHVGWSTRTHLHSVQHIGLLFDVAKHLIERLRARRHQEVPKRPRAQA